MPRLVVERGSEKGVSLTLDAQLPTVIVGRLQTCNLVLTDYLVSRQHFQVQREGENYFIVDLNSHNGTYVNGVRIQGQAEIQTGSTIRAGETLFSFLAGSQTAEGSLAGTKVGGYHLLERLGVGGMGEVYKAMQLLLGRTVALKMLSPELTRDSVFVERFLSEARQAGRFNHPNVIHVHEVGEDNGM